MIPETRNLSNKVKVSEYVDGNFFRCISPFLSWLKKGEIYQLEYNTGTGTYEAKNIGMPGKEFSMTTHQLLTCFLPCECEGNICVAMKHAHWLGELGIHHGYIDDACEVLRPTPKHGIKITEEDLKALEERNKV